MAGKPKRQHTAAEKRMRQYYRRRGILDCGLCAGPIDPDLHWLDPLSLTVDHIIPVSRGGVTTTENCQPAHRSCNRLKSDRVLTAPESTPRAKRPAVTLVTSRTW